MGAKTRLFFRRFRGVSHVTGALPIFRDDAIVVDGVGSEVR
jgi:hypothetical protein